MPDVSTLIRDYGLVPTIIVVAILALAIYSIFKGGTKGGSGKSSGGSGTTPHNTNPPPTTGS